MWHDSSTRLVLRSKDRQDARVVLLAPTAAGENLVAQRRSDGTQRLDRALSPSPDDVARIADAVPALTRLADALRRTSKEVAR